MDLIELLQYSFIRKAFIAGSFVAILCSVLGLFLVLRKMALIGHGLAHVSFGAIALGLFLGVYPIYVAVPIAIVSSYFVLQITVRAKIYEDAAIGIISAVGVAGGVILASLSKGFNVDLFSYLFGSILSISMAEVYLSVILSLAVLLILYLFYQELFSATFDEEYAKVTGIKTNRLNAVLAALTAVTVVLSIRIVGVMLVAALLILPSVTALQIARGFRKTIFVGIAVALASVISGIVVSFYWDLPAGAAIVLINFIVFVVFSSIKYFRLK